MELLEKLLSPLRILTTEPHDQPAVDPAAKKTCKPSSVSSLRNSTTVIPRVTKSTGRLIRRNRYNNTVESRVVKLTLRSDEVKNTLLEAETTATIQSHIQNIGSNDIQFITLQKYEKCIKVYGKWLNGREISEKTAREFISHLKEQNFARSTIRSYYSAIKPFLASQGINIRIKFKKHKTLPKYHSVDQVKKILEAAKSRSDRWRSLAGRDYLVICLLAYTGIRRGEALSLRKNDINVDSGYITVHGKGDNERAIPIHPILKDLLIPYLVDFKAQDRILPFKQKRLWSIVTRYARAAGINDFHPHSLRHFFGTTLLEQGSNLKNVQELMGHESISTTAVYIDVLPKHLRSAISKLPDLSD